MIENDTKLKQIKTQGGATLVVALIILLVMTLIGVSSIKSSTLQERMAGNARQKAIAKNAALVALKEGENLLAATIVNPPKVPNLNPFNGSGSLYSVVIRPGPQAAAPVTFDVKDAAAWANNGTASSAVSTSLVSQQPKYIIEYMGKVNPPSEKPVTSLDNEEKDRKEKIAYAFRVTAIGWGRDANITTVLESTFVTGKD